MKTSQKNNSIKFLGLFLFFGIAMILLGGGLFGYGFYKQSKMTEVKGTITNYETYQSESGTKRRTHFNLFVSYDFEGQHYQDVYLDYDTNEVELNGPIDLMVDPENPGEPYKKDKFLLYLLVLGVGVLFTAVCIFMKKAGGSGKTNKLVKTGIALDAVVTEIYRASVVVAGQEGRVVKCYYQGADREYEFKSKTYFAPLEQFIQPNMPIKVFVNPNNYAKYYVDVKSLMDRVKG